MVRFIHTADWQLGLRLRYIPGDDGAVLRDARLTAVENIGALARAQSADFVVVAGDVFEHHGLKPATLRKTFDVLRGFPCPVYLLPGNHDPLTPDGLWTSAVWQGEAPDNVHVLRDTTPVPVKGGHLLPCPLLRRHTLDDLTAHLTPAFGPAQGLRIGVAHGGIKEILEGLRESDPDEQSTGATNPIRLHAARDGGLDYMALGDWHGTRQVDDRTWYSGAPAATRFKEKEPGNALVVTLEAPGEPPQVKSHRVGTHHWVQKDYSLRAPEDVAALDGWLEQVPDKRAHLVELFLEGSLTLGDNEALRQVLDRQGGRLAWLRVREEQLHVLLNEDELDHIARDGWVREVVDDLKARAAGDPTAQAALRLLYELDQEAIR